MRGTFIRFGIDRCPATKNYSSASVCHHCDFLCTAKKEQCECSFSQLGKREKPNSGRPFTSIFP